MKQITIALMDENNSFVDGLVTLYDVNADYSRFMQESSVAGVIKNVDIPVGKYLARVMSDTTTFIPKVIDVLESDSDSIYVLMNGVSKSIGVPTDARLCRVIGRVVDSCNNPIKGLDVSFLLESGKSNIGGSIQSIYGRHRTNENGEIDVMLNRNCYYVLTGIPHLNYVEEELPQGVGITVPDTPVAYLLDLVAPIPKLVLPTEITTNAGGLTFLPDITMTDGKKLLQNLNDYIQVVSESLTVMVSTTGIIINELPAGVHTVSFYAKTFNSKEVNTKGIVRRFGLSEPVGVITITAT
jgi:hypothetical protein